MESFREFEAGPDPFGRKWQVLFKWMQTAISIRMADAIDSKFMLIGEGDEAERMEKVISMRHPDLLALSAKTGHEISDPYVCRLAAEHLKHMVETWEDMDKDLVTISPEHLSQYHGQILTAK